MCITLVETGQEQTAWRCRNAARTTPGIADPMGSLLPRPTHERGSKYRGTNNGGVVMLNRRILMGLVFATSISVAVGIAYAKNAHHVDGHNLLGAKLNQNGKHEISKIGNNAVTAEVSNKKVAGMSAGNLPAKKVKSNKKMAEIG